ncbi:MAG: serine O-acetyltransferase EpsC [Candidatus Borkfalkiaceae bacterium]|nr:serine acetyltransferase [Clostridia bacterium]MDY6223621.1 serine O-acetyltransferase EpsC [Christensenellaceae bacterium]
MRENAKEIAKKNAENSAENHTDESREKGERFGETLFRAANAAAEELGSHEKVKDLSGLCLFEETIKELIDDVRAALFPEVFCCNDSAAALFSAAQKLRCTLYSALGGDEGKTEEISLKFLDELPEMRRVLYTDCVAGYRGDPAATSEKEVALCYPYFYAMCVQRIAHFLYTEKVPVLPRMMSEIAHAGTGIDIHPGAQIGEYFFIDHGTGVVIGETAVIGKNVKLYQGVTLGAKSFKVNDDGSLVKGIKRHPEVRDDVVIYAGATILGGNTVIGKGAVIGGNAWVTHSVKDGEAIPSNYVG